MRQLVMTSLALLLITAVWAGDAAGPALTQVDYTHAGTALRGWVARPTGTGPFAGVLVVPEWWGLGDYAKGRAAELAAAGYVAFACDIYGTGKYTSDPKQAGEWAGPFYADPALMVARATAGLDALRQQPGVDAQRLAGIGFCFGGSVCLQLARSGAPLKAVAAFHPGLKTVAPASGPISTKILVLHGGSDQFVPPTEVATFMDEMVKAKADWRMEVYGTCLHAFTNPGAGVTTGIGLPIRYDEAATKDAFAAMHRLFAATLAR